MNILLEECYNNFTVAHLLKTEKLDVIFVQEFLLNKKPSDIKTIIALLDFTQDGDVMKWYHEKEHISYKTRSFESVLLFLMSGHSSLSQIFLLDGMEFSAPILSFSDYAQKLEEYRNAPEKYIHIDLLFNRNRVTREKLNQYFSTLSQEEVKGFLSLKNREVISYIKRKSSEKEFNYLMLETLNFKEIIGDDEDSRGIMKYWHDELIDDIIKVGKELMVKFPNSWKKVLSPLYIEFIKPFIKKIPAKFTREKVIDLSVIFTDLFPKNINNLNDFGISLILLPENILSYVLGFPIQEYHPTKEQLFRMVFHLCEENTNNEEKEKEHIDWVKNFNKERLKTFSRFEEVILVNDKDTYLENVYDYNPFDVVFYCEGKHVYIFTRPEFENIIKTEENPYTKKQLPYFVKQDILSRISFCKEQSFPDSCTVEETYEKIKEGTYFSMEDSIDEYIDELAQPILGYFQNFFSGINNIFVANNDNLNGIFSQR